MRFISLYCPVFKTKKHNLIKVNMNSTVETILLYMQSQQVSLSIVYGYFIGKNILNSSAGNSKMQDIASAIQIGAKAYLARQYKNYRNCWNCCFSNYRCCL